MSLDDDDDDDDDDDYDDDDDDDNDDDDDDVRTCSQVSDVQLGAWLMATYTHGLDLQVSLSVSLSR